jgi:hypothetical protein
MGALFCGTILYVALFSANFAPMDMAMAPMDLAPIGEQDQMEKRQILSCA